MCDPHPDLGPEPLVNFEHIRYQEELKAERWRLSRCDASPTRRHEVTVNPDREADPGATLLSVTCRCCGAEGYTSRSDIRWSAP